VARVMKSQIMKSYENGDQRSGCSVVKGVYNMRTTDSELRLRQCVRVVKVDARMQ
jgi:hypothetical protein